MKYFLLSLICLLALTSGIYAYDEERELTLPVEKMSRLFINCRTGAVSVQGVEGLEEIVVFAKIHLENSADVKAAKAYLEKHLILTLVQKGDNYYLESKFNEGLFGTKDSKHITLIVAVPPKLSVDITNGSGNILIQLIDSDVKVKDGSGTIIIRKIVGNIVVDDGSGDIEILDITGNVSIEDGSGDTRVTNILGSVTIKDGSGDIDFSLVEKDVTILNAGSGQVILKNIKGKVEQ